MTLLQRRQLIQIIMLKYHSYGQDLKSKDSDGLSIFQKLPLSFFYTVKPLQSTLIYGHIYVLLLYDCVLTRYICVILSSLYNRVNVS